MHRYHRLKSSTTQLIVVSGVGLLTAVTIYFCLSPPLLKWSALAGIAIYTVAEYRRLIQLENISIRFIPQASAIELQQAGQPYLYFKYKVYQTRWFAILKLMDRKENRTLVLNSDCFESTECYRLCRFELRQMESFDVA